MEWQYACCGDGAWEFGPKVRGLVRSPVARVERELYYGTERWSWLVVQGGTRFTGAATDPLQAIEQAEAKMADLGLITLE